MKSLIAKALDVGEVEPFEMTPFPKSPSFLEEHEVFQRWGPQAGSHKNLGNGPGVRECQEKSADLLLHDLIIPRILGWGMTDILKRK